jgi:diguanylate cyclase (GGDEF)-like protein/PAS domain S-box-containing protein
MIEVIGSRGAVDAKVLPFPNSEDVLRSILEHASIGMSLVDMEGRVVYANRSFSTMFGYSVSECIGLHASDLVDAEMISSAERQLKQLIRGEIPSYRSERRYRRSDGTSFWGLASASMVRANGGGQPLYLIVQIADIDGEKSALAALAESESRWNFALDSAGQGVWDHDLRTGKVFYSPRWKILRGFHPDEKVDPASWLSRVHPDDRGRILEQVRRQDSGELKYNEFEYRERHQDGHWIWILSRGKPVEWLPDGSVARILGTDTDISHLKHIEEKLAAEREWLAVTLDAIADGVIATDPQHRITIFNPAAEQLTGCAQHSALGQSLGDVFRVRGEEAEGSLLDLLSALAGATPRMMREGTLLTSAAGEERVVRECASAVRKADGTVIGGVLVFQDVTESYRARRDLSYAATHDALTGLFNRVAFEQELRDAISEIRSDQERQHALCYADLDRFKEVNDSAGHLAGDALLTLVGKAMMEVCRTQDHCARVGGDEFAIILRDCDLEAAHAVVNTLARRVGNLAFEWKGCSYQTNVSIGVVALAPTKSASDLLAAADAECYRRKQHRRVANRQLPRMK